MQKLVMGNAKINTSEQIQNCHPSSTNLANSEILPTQVKQVHGGHSIHLTLLALILNKTVASEIPQL